MSSKSLSEIDRRIARRVKLARQAAGLSQEGLAERIGVTYQQLQKYEMGVNRITAGRLLQIAQALRHEIAFFFEDDAAEEPRILPRIDVESVQALRQLPVETRRAVDQLLAAMLATSSAAR